MNTLKASAKTPKVQFLYELHRTPPAVMAYYPDGSVYRSIADGTTYRLDGSFEVPYMGCPFPERLLTVIVMAYIIRNHRLVIGTMFAVAILVVTQFAIWQLPDAPIDELKLSFIALTSFLINAVLIVGMLFAVAAAILWNFGKGWVVTRPGDTETLALPSGEISIAPDILVVLHDEQESAAAMADRIEAARKAQRDGQWIVTLSYRHIDGLIIFSSKPGEEFDGMRFRREEWGEAHDACGVSDYSRETWLQYRTYCERFAADFSDWSAQEKPRFVDPVKALIARLHAAAAKTAAVLLPLLFFVFSATAQKSAQAAHYLGEYRYQNDRPQGEVKFIFQQAIILRKGDGTRTYKDILPNALAYTDAQNAGALIGITVDGKKIQPEAPETTAGKLTPIQPRTMTSRMETSAATATSSIPDSAQIAERLDVAQVELDRWKTQGWAAIRPAWRFFMWLFTGLMLPVLALLGGILYYISKTAAGESAVNLHGTPIFGRFMVRAHQNAAGLLMLLVWIAGVVWLINSFFWMVWWGFSWAAIVPTWFINLWLTGKITNWLVPNMRIVAKGNNPGGQRFPQIEA